MPNRIRRLLVSWPVASIASSALAQSPSSQPAWPTKPIQIVVPYAAGGQTDAIARLFGTFLSKHFEVPVVVVNKAGASGVIGVSQVVHAPADGHTVLCSLSPPLIQNRVLVKGLPYNPERDFTYLSTIDTIGVPVVAAERTEIKTLPDLIAYARSSNGLNFGAYGLGTLPHVLAGLLARQYGLHISTVQYRGESPMWADVRGQTLELAAGSLAGAAPVIQSGHGRLIAVLGNRLPPYPDVPTLIEQGAVGEAFGITGFTAFAVLSGVPSEIVQLLSSALVQAGSDPRVKDVLATLLVKPPTSQAAAQARFMKETTVILKLLEDLNIKAE